MLKWQYWHKCLTLHCNWVFHLWSFITSFKNNLLPHGVGGRGQAEINISIQWEILVIQSFSFCVEENRSAYKKALTFFFFPERKSLGKKSCFNFIKQFLNWKDLFCLSAWRSCTPFCWAKLTSHVNTAPCSNSVTIRLYNQSAPLLPISSPQVTGRPQWGPLETSFCQAKQAQSLNLSHRRGAPALG